MQTYLGNFIKLPYELRLMIWEELRPHGQDKTTADTASSKQSRRIPKSGLSILRANRGLHDEIHRPLYKNMVMAFEISPVYEKDVWITANCRQGQAVWKLQNEDDAVGRGFLDLPYDRVDVVVDIVAPDNRDQAQLVCLWGKISRFVDFMGGTQRNKKGKNIQDMTIRFRKNAITGSDWYDYANEMMIVSAINIANCEQLPMKAFDPINGMHYYSNSDVAFTPFLRLRNAQSITVTAHSEELYKALNWDLINLRNSNSNNNNNPAAANMNIKRANLHLNYTLDLSLDILPSRTASMLRLNRFASWFPKGHSGTSTYETTLLLILHELPDLVHHFDPHLDMITYRLQALLALNPERRKWNTHRRHRHKEGWNPVAWAQEFPDGIPAFGTRGWKRIVGRIGDFDTDGGVGEAVWGDYFDKGEFYLRFRDEIMRLRKKMHQ